MSSAETDHMPLGDVEAAPEIEDKPEDVTKPAEIRNNAPPPSKKSLKRLKKKEKWEKTKMIRRQAEREKYKIKRKQLKEQNLPLPVSRKQLKRNRVDFESDSCRVAIDLSFEDDMTASEMTKCSKQLLRSYTLNRRAEIRMPLYLCGLKDSGPFFDIFKLQDGYQHWDVKMTPSSYLDTFPREKIVYLSSDSENLLERLDKDDVYVIGGLVDHNRYKGMCHQRAVAAGIRHARLPLPEKVMMKTRTVLTIEQVFNILLQVHNGLDWGAALLAVIPKRKGARAKAPKTDDKNVKAELDEEAMSDDNELDVDCPSGSDGSPSSK